MLLTSVDPPRVLVSFLRPELLFCNQTLMHIIFMLLPKISIIFALLIHQDASIVVKQLQGDMLGNGCLDTAQVSMRLILQIQRHQLLPRDYVESNLLQLLGRKPVLS